MYPRNDMAWVRVQSTNGSTTCRIYLVFHSALEARHSATNDRVGFPEKIAQ